jgi:hypothetical protein
MKRKNAGETPALQERRGTEEKAHRQECLCYGRVALH